MLKTIRSSDVSGPEIRNGDSEIDGFGVGGDDEELAKKSGKLKGQKLAKSRKLSKSGKSKGKKSKKLSKSRYLPKFDVTEAKPSFLTSGAKEAFNRLRLAFIKAPIFGHFDQKCYIQIKTDVSDYVISSVLS